jgi:hypothetical protein
MTAARIGNVLLAFSFTPLMATLAPGLLGSPVVPLAWVPCHDRRAGAVRHPAAVRRRWSASAVCWRTSSSTSTDRPRRSRSLSTTRSASLRPLRCSSDPFETSAARPSAPVVRPTARRAEPHPFI